MKTYTIRGEFSMTLVVKNDEVIDRVVRENGDFEHFPYHFEGTDNDREFGGVEMLAFNCGLKSADLTSLDGWADLSDEDIKITDTEIRMTDLERDGVALPVPF